MLCRAMLRGSVRCMFKQTDLPVVSKLSIRNERPIKDIDFPAARQFRTIKTSRRQECDHSSHKRHDYRAVPQASC